MEKNSNSDVKLLSEKYNKWWQNSQSYSHHLPFNDKRVIKSYRKIISFLTRSGEGCLLDVCCGKGNFLSYLEDNSNFELFGIDISKIAIKEARRYLKKAKVFVGNIQNLPFEDNYFDYISCLGSLEHLSQPLEGAKEISRLLKPQGKALILVPNLFFLGHIYMALRYGSYPSEGRQQFSEMFSTLEGWKNLLEEGNLEIVKVHKYNEIWATKKVSKFLIFIWNLIKSFVPGGFSYAFIFICKKRIR